MNFYLVFELFKLLINSFLGGIEEKTKRKLNSNGNNQLKQFQKYMQIKYMNVWQLKLLIKIIHAFLLDILKEIVKQFISSAYSLFMDISLGFFVEISLIIS